MSIHVQLVVGVIVNSSTISRYSQSIIALGVAPVRFCRDSLGAGTLRCRFTEVCFALDWPTKLGTFLSDNPAQSALDGIGDCFRAAQAVLDLGSDLLASRRRRRIGRRQERSDRGGKRGRFELGMLCELEQEVRFCDRVKRDVLIVSVGA